jgi:trehalose 6-phosphate synthase
VTVVVSNRGPVRFVPKDGGGFEPVPAPGGVASALGPLFLSGAAGDGASWVASAVDEGDRAAAVASAVRVEGIDLRLVAHDPDLYRLYSDIVANGTLWFLHHGLFDLPRRPRFDHRFREAWASFETVNGEFADAAAEQAADGDVVLVQDYHLGLVPEMLRNRRPDLRIAHFTHTPFCGPNSIRVLPVEHATALCRSMAGCPTGFHAARWARAFEASARDVLGAEAPIMPSFVSPISPNVDELERVRAAPETEAAIEELKELVGDRRLIVRADRMDPSKNIPRGFAAFDLLLSEHREWRERVVFVARVTQTRQTMPEYLAYASEVEQAAERVNDRWATKDWQPVVLDTRDDYGRTLAALSCCDVLLVNPVKDGLNLVAKEGPLLNDRGVLCLSRDAGAWDELQEGALEIHPFDLEQNASTLHAALSMPDGERASRAARLRELVLVHSPRGWLDDQLRAARAS